jgi:hypothetical protein
MVSFSVDGEVSEHHQSGDQCGSRLFQWFFGQVPEPVADIDQCFGQ